MTVYGMRLTVAYDGTEFCGWQKQDRQRSVQGELEATIAKMTGHAVALCVASRTDAGVHALGNVAAFSTTRDIDPQSWLRGLNSEAPEDIAVTEVHACSPDYNPRFDTVGKRYRYVLDLSAVPHPLWRRLAWRPRVSAQHFDWAALETAAKAFVGTHDFAAFRNSADQRTNTVRTVADIQVISHFASEPTLFAVEIEGNAFLHHMVRIIVGTLIQVGKGRLSLEDIKALLQSRASRSEAGVTAPAHGLCLLKVMLGRHTGHLHP